MKKAFALILATLLVFAVVPVVASAAGDSIETATTISLNTQINGNITADNTVDIYKFTLSESGRVAIKITAHIYKTHYRLYNANGTEIWSATYQTWNSVSQQYSNEFVIDLTSGDYYFSAIKYDGEGNYNFSVKYTPANESFKETTGGIDNSISTANKIELGTSYNGQLALNDSIDTYKFNLPTSGRINLKLAAYIYKTHFYIYNCDGNEVWSSKYQAWNDVSKEYNKNDYIDLTSGDYYFSVSRYDGTGNYNFRINAVSADESFEETTGGIDNSISTANKIELGTSYNGQLAINDSTDTYKFALPASDTINLKLTAYIYKTHYYIYDIDGNEVWSSRYQYWNDTSKEYNKNENIDLAAGDYYFSVTKYDGTGNYNFTINLASQVTSLGDANNDGYINSLDAATVLKYDAFIISLDSAALTAADVNGDGSVNSLDAAMILKYDAGIIDSF